MASPSTASFGLSPRSGGRPRTTRQTPHLQLDQPSAPDIQAELVRRMATLDGTTMGGVASPRPRRWHSTSMPIWPGVLMTPTLSALSSRIFTVTASGSLHLTLPLVVAREVIEREWAEMHPAARMGHAPNTLVMVYGPRDDAELSLTWELVGRSYDYARGL